MDGVTAESIRDLFKNGEAQATSVSDKNDVKQKAFSDAADALNGLRSALTQIAAEGNAKIDEIMQSKKNAVQKLGEIVDVISEKQGEAASKSTQYGSAITGAIQNVLAADGDSRSPEQFAADNGIDLTSPPSPPQQGHTSRTCRADAHRIRKRIRMPLISGKFRAKWKSTNHELEETPQQRSNGVLSAHCPATPGAPDTNDLRASKDPRQRRVGLGGSFPCDNGKERPRKLWPWTCTWLRIN